jgi:hypothetical protein
MRMSLSGGRSSFAKLAVSGLLARSAASRCLWRERDAMAGRRRSRHIESDVK